MCSFTFLGCTEAKLKSNKSQILAATKATPPKPHLSGNTAGFAIVYGGGISTHPNIMLEGTIGPIGRPLVQTSAGAQNIAGYPGVLYTP